MTGTTEFAALGPGASKVPSHVALSPRLALAWWPAWFIAAAVALILVGIGYAMHGRPLAEKTLTALAMPLGGLWLLTTGRLLHLTARCQLSGGKMLLGLWLVLVAGGTRPLPEALSRYLETSITSYDPTRQQALDVAIVLGGGTDQGIWRAQVGGAGDRVVLAAELFHSGQVSELVTTGQATAGVSGIMRAPSDQTIEIWTGLGIPRSAISTLGGRNTSEEIAQVKQAWSRFADKRVGLITSANHLPRAMRLARAQGLDLIPVAADVRWKPIPWRLLDWIPTAGNFSSLAQNQHELMAYFVSR